MRRGRLSSVLGILLGSGLLLISTTQTWFDVVAGPDGASIAAPGSTAAPLLAPLALAGLALGLALSLVGTVLRYALAVLAVAIGATSAVTAFTIAATAPITAVAPSVTEVTGIAGTPSLAEIVTSMIATPWPWIAGFAGSLIAIVGVYALVTARMWAQSGRRYESDTAASGRAAPPTDAVGVWDDLSRGDDPTR